MSKPLPNAMLVRISTPFQEYIQSLIDSKSATFVNYRGRENVRKDSVGLRIGNLVSDSLALYPQLDKSYDDPFITSYTGRRRIVANDTYVVRVLLRTAGEVEHLKRSAKSNRNTVIVETRNRIFSMLTHEEVEKYVRYSREMKEKREMRDLKLLHNKGLIEEFQRKERSRSYG